MSKIRINNNNLSPVSAQAMQNLALLISENQNISDSDIQISNVVVNHTKGELLNTILITIGTTVASELIVYFIKEAIDRFLGKSSTQISIKEKENGDVKIEVENSDADLKLSVEIDSNTDKD